MKIIPQSITRTVGRSILKAKKNSPHVFFAGGVIGVIGGTVLACRATLKVSPVLDDFKEELETVKGLNETDVYDEESEYYKDLAYVYAKNVVKIGKLYGPAVLVSGVSVAALTGSHVALTRRNAALTAAFTAVSKGFEEYRKRVREELGAEKELDIYHAARKEAIEHADGTKEVLKVVDSGAYSPYARIFDEYTPNWQKDAEYNRMFVECQQSYANQKLQARGHIFLNEVYDMFGFDHTSEGAVVGWIRESENGDGFIDFGLYEVANRDFGKSEKSIVLDFNVDGVIYDLI